MDESLKGGTSVYPPDSETLPYTIYQRLKGVDKLVGMGHLHRVGGNCIYLGDLLHLAIRGRLVLYYDK